ncbi:MAG: hypothetical protein AB8B99_07380 [Phormidesmis sp.]
MALRLRRRSAAALPNANEADNGLSPVSKVRLDARRKSVRTTKTLENLVFVVFVLLGTVGLFHHELWRDETQSWLLARDSASVFDLFRNAHYEGHPLLWHYCLFFISRFSRSLISMQVFNLLLAIGSAWLIVKKSPFSLLERSLLIFGYFTFYEYALLSRSYGLGVFLAFLFCALYCGRRIMGPWRAWWLTVSLALLANTSILGLIISGVLAIALYYRFTVAAEQTLRKSIGAHFFVLVMAWAASAFQIGRSLLNPMGLEGFDAEARAATAGNDTAQIIVKQTADSTLLADGFENADKLLQIVLKSHLPLPTFRFHAWNEHLLESQSFEGGLEPPALHTSSELLLLALSTILVGFVLVVAFQLLRKTRLFLFIYASGCLSMTAVFVGAYRGATRHYGHLFILLLVCLWLAKWSRQHLSRSAPQPLSSKLFTAILCVQVIAGIYAYTSDLFYPFSASYQTAQILETQLNSLPVLAINQRPASPISAYLDQPLFYPEAEKFGSFWDISYPDINDEAGINDAFETFSALYSDFVAVLTLPLSEQLSSSLTIQYLAYIGPSIVEDEAFYLYLVSADAD